MAPDDAPTEPITAPTSSTTSTTSTSASTAMGDSSSSSSSNSGHHATNLLYEAVERQQKLREEQEAQAAQAAAAAAAASSEGDGDAQVSEYGDVRTKNIPDLYYLFTNDKLKEEPLTKVLHSDPFVIPRLTDNVPEYRPAFNPLSILEGEEKLLPRYFRLDPFEGIPGVTDKDKRDKRAAIRARTGSASGAGSFVVGKTTTFMGTMPRQSEFSEIPVPDSLFQTQQTFRPTPPPPPAPHPSYASKNLDLRPRSATGWGDSQAAISTASESSTATISASAALSRSSATTTAAAPVTPTALTDAMFLTSLHQSGSDRQTHDYYASSSNQYTQANYYQQQQQQQEPDSTAETLTRYLPTLSRSPPPGSANYTPSLYLDESSSYQRQPHQSYQQELHSNGDIQYLGQMLEDYRDSDATTGAGDEGGSSSSSALGAVVYDHGPSQPAGDTQSLQPIPKKPRSKNVFRPCTAPGCTKGARGKSGLCQKHGGGKRCSIAGCAKGAQGSSTMCLFHGGGYRCTVDGCSTGARGTSGLCAKHGGYKRGAKEIGGGADGGGSSPSSSNGGVSGKRARKQPADGDGDAASGGSAAEADGPGTSRIESGLFS